MTSKSNHPEITPEALDLVQQIGQDLVTTWQQSDPISALNSTLRHILQQVDERVITDQKISAIVYIYDEAEGFHSGEAIGPLKEYMQKYPPRKGGTAEYIIQQKKPLFVDDVSTMPPGSPPLSKWAKEHGVKSLANLPLLVGEGGQQTVVGTLILNLQMAHSFDQEQQDILRLFATQAAIALQNARVHRRRLLEIAAIRRISELTTTGKPGQVETMIARQAVELTRAAYATLWSVGQAGVMLQLKGAFYTGPWEPPQQTLSIDNSSINGYVALTKKSYYSANLHDDPYYARWHSHIKAAMCVPLLIRQELMGTLYVATTNENGVSENNRGFIEQLAHHAAIALHNARLLEQEHQSRVQAEAFQAIIAELRTTLDLKKVGDVILTQLKRIIPFQTASLQQIDRHDHRTLFAAKGFDINRAKSHFTRDVGDDPIIAEVVQSKSVTILSDVNQYEHWDTELDTINSWAGVPLVIDDEVIGLLTLDHGQPGFYTADNHNQILETFGHHASMAIRNAQLFSREQRRSKDLDALNQSALELGALSQTPAVYRAVVDAVVDTLHCDYCTVFLWNREKGTLVTEESGGTLFEQSPKLEFAPGEGLAGFVYQHNRALIVPDTTQDGRYKPRESGKPDEPRSMMLAPLRAGAQPIGVVSADMGRIDAFDDEDLRLLETLVSHAGAVLQNIRYLNDLQVLHTTASELTQKNTEREIYELVVDAAARSLRCNHSTLFIYDRLSGRLVARARKGVPQNSPEPHRFKPGEGLAGQAFETGRAQLVNDAAKEPHFIKGVVTPHSAPRSMVLAPVIAENTVIGVLTADKDEINGFTSNNLEILETLALDAGIAINLRKERDRLQAITRFQQAISNILLEAEQLEQIRENLGALMDVSSIFIGLLNEPTATLHFPLAYQEGQCIPDHQKTEGRIYSACRFGTRRGVTEWVINHKESLLITTPTDWTPLAAEIDEKFRKSVQSTLVVPMMLQEKPIGVIGLQNFHRSHVFDVADRRVLETVAAQAAIAIDNARLYEGEQAQIERLSTLFNIGQKITAAEQLDEILDTITEDVVNLVKARRSLFLLVDSETRQVTGRRGHGYSTGEMEAISFDEVEAGVSGWVLKHKMPVLVEDAQTDPRNTGIALEKAIHFKTSPLIVAPLLLRGEVIGTLTAVNDSGDPPFTDEDRRTVVMLADQAAIAIDNVERLQRRIKELEAVNEFQHRISDINTVEQELEDIYTSAVEVMSDLMDTRNMYIALYDQPNQMIEFGLVREGGKPMPKGKMWKSRQLGERKGLTEWVIRHKKSLLVDKDFDDWAAKQKDVEVYEGVTKCWLGAPMIFRDRVIGVIGLQNFEREHVFDQNHKRLLEMIAGQAAVAIDNAHKLDRRLAELRAISRFQQQIIRIGTE